MPARFVGVTGLPRAGSTLMCQLLAQHPDIHCEGHSSPLCHVLTSIRRMISDDQFFLAQLDQSFERSYDHLTSAMKAFLQGWYQNCDKQVVADKNRIWLNAIELLLHMEPEAKLIVCIRELGQVYGSIEAQHQRTIMVDFIDHLADLDRIDRAEKLFAPDKGVIGIPLKSLNSVQELPLKVRERLCFIRFEDLLDQPVKCMSQIFAWLGLSSYPIDPEKLTRLGPSESDSHYRMKYLHKWSDRIMKPARHEIPPRIQANIEKDFPWFYKTYYPATRS